MVQEREFDFVPIVGDEVGLNTMDAARYLKRSYPTLRNILSKNPWIKKYRIGQGNKQFLLKKDLDWLLDHPDVLYGNVASEGEIPEESFDFVDIKGRPALNMSQSAGYLGMSYSALQKKLAKHPDIKKVTRPDAREKYLFKDDLDKLKEFQFEGEG